MSLKSNRQDRPPRGQGLALVGYRGTGKSTVGQILAERLNRPFLDADLELEARAGRSIASIFAEDGEPAFRAREARTLQVLVRGHPAAVLATGGGVVLRPANRRLLRRFGFVAWLKADPAELALRLHADRASGKERPALTTAGLIAEIAAVLEHRAALYREVADAEVETEGRTPDEVAGAILTFLTYEDAAGDPATMDGAP
jgi:shikimate kinase